MNTPQRIGILGGMGPQATILFQQKLVDAVQAEGDCDHMPLIVDMNPQVPSRIEHLIYRRGDDPAPILAGMAKGLQAAGADALAMPCNTAHYYADAIETAVSVPFLNMVELAADRAVKELGQDGCVGILASPAVQLTGLFDKALKRVGLKTLWLDSGPEMLRAIQAVKTKGQCQEAHDTFHAASCELAKRGAVFQLVACSEFSLLVDSIAPNVRGVDTLDVLVDALCDFSFKKTDTLEIEK